MSVWLFTEAEADPALTWTDNDVGDVLVELLGLLKYGDCNCCINCWACDWAVIMVEETMAWLSAFPRVL